MSDGPNMITEENFWHTLGERATGIIIVTAQGRDGPAGFLGLSATHVSAKPPTMLVSIDLRTAALSTVLESRHFAINYLPAAAREIADRFSAKSAFKGADRFEASRWNRLTTGAPIFNDALGAFDCVLEETYKHPSSIIAIGRVVDLFAKGCGEPLLFFRGHYIL